MDDALLKDLNPLEFFIIPAPSVVNLPSQFEHLSRRRGVKQVNATLMLSWVPGCPIVLPITSLTVPARVVLNAFLRRLPGQTLRN